MINLKQEELSHWLVDQLKQRYPEVEFVRIQPSVDDPEALWVRIVIRKILSASPDEVKEML